jgi:hypothetical protein
LDEILHRGYDIEDDLDSILLNTVASIIPKYDFLTIEVGATFSHWWIWMKFCIEAMTLR